MITTKTRRLPKGTSGDLFKIKITDEARECLDRLREASRKYNGEHYWEDSDSLIINRLIMDTVEKDMSDLTN